MFRLYIFSHRQAAYRTLKDKYKMHYNKVVGRDLVCALMYNYTKLHKVHGKYTRVGTLIVATIYLQLIQNRYMFRSFTVLQCSHQHCVQHGASDVEVVGYL